jgi:ribosomal protein S18 acetylase RimI-like enzyme
VAAGWARRCSPASKRRRGAPGSRPLRLETGTEQAAAIALYEGCGFRPCGAFGHYAGLEPHRIAASLFFEKPL